VPLGEHVPQVDNPCPPRTTSSCATSSDRHYILLSTHSSPLYFVRRPPGPAATSGRPLLPQVPSVGRHPRRHGTPFRRTRYSDRQACRYRSESFAMTCLLLASHFFLYFVLAYYFRGFSGKPKSGTKKSINLCDFHYCFVSFSSKFLPHNFKLASLTIFVTVAMLLFCWYWACTWGLNTRRLFAPSKRFPSPNLYNCRANLHDFFLGRVRKKTGQRRCGDLVFGHALSIRKNTRSKIAPV